MKAANKFNAKSGEYNLKQINKIYANQGAGSVTVNINKLKAEYVLIKVQGAEVTKAIDGSGSPIKISKGIVKVTKTMPITFQLKNLDNVKSFTIGAERYNGPKMTNETQICFAVHSPEYNL